MALVEEGLRDLLVSAGAGEFEYDGNDASKWSIHIGKLPSTPHRVICITDTGGRSPDPKWLLDFPSFQIRVRGAPGGTREAKLKAQRAKDLFLGFTSVDVNGDRWVSITMLTDVTFIGYDETDRPNYVVNLQMIVEPAQTADNTNREPI